MDRASSEFEQPQQCGPARLVLRRREFEVVVVVHAQHVRGGLARQVEGEVEIGRAEPFEERAPAQAVGSALLRLDRLVDHVPRRRVRAERRPQHGDVPGDRAFGLWAIERLEPGGNALVPEQVVAGQLEPAIEVRVGPGERVGSGGREALPVEVGRVQVALAGD